MAWLEQEKTGIYHICFRFQGARIKKSASTRDERKAGIKLARIEENLDRVERGHLTVPPDAVNRRSEESGLRGRPVSTGTISKELATFRTLWRWASQSEFVTPDFPNQGLRYPRQQQKLSSLTCEQIQQRIRRRIPEGQTEADYWDCLYLNKDELNELLSDIQKSASYEFIFPMCFMAAQTGARRSELCRSLREDIEFESDAILIREKKKQKGKETFRHVPMSPRLHTVLNDWLGRSALCSYTFPAEYRVSRTRNGNRCIDLFVVLRRWCDRNGLVRLGVSRRVRTACHPIRQAVVCCMLLLGRR